MVPFKAPSLIGRTEMDLLELVLSSRLLERLPPHLQFRQILKEYLNLLVYRIHPAFGLLRRPMLRVHLLPPLKSRSCPPEIYAKIVADCHPKDLYSLLLVSRQFFFLAIRRFHHLSQSINSMRVPPPTGPSPSVQDWIDVLAKITRGARQVFGGRPTQNTRHTFHRVEKMLLGSGKLFVVGNLVCGGPRGIWWTDKDAQRPFVPLVEGYVRDIMCTDGLIRRARVLVAALDETTAAISVHGEMFLQDLKRGEATVPIQLPIPLDAFEAHETPEVRKQERSLEIIAMAHMGDRLAVIVNTNRNGFMVVWKWQRKSEQLLVTYWLGPMVDPPPVVAVAKYHIQFVHPLLILTSVESPALNGNIFFPLPRTGYNLRLPTDEFISKRAHFDMSQNPRIQFVRRAYEFSMPNSNLPFPYSECQQGGFMRPDGTLWAEPETGRGEITRGVVRYTVPRPPDLTYHIVSNASGYRLLLSNRRLLSDRERGSWERYFVYESSPPLVALSVTRLHPCNYPGPKYLQQTNAHAAPQPVFRRLEAIEPLDDQYFTVGAKLVLEIDDRDFLHYLTRAELPVHLEENGDSAAVAVPGGIGVFKFGNERNADERQPFCRAPQI